MLVIKSVPIQDRPVRLTCTVTRFRYTEFPGWRVVRMRGKFWQFPPLPLSEIPTDLIERTYNDADYMRVMRTNMAVTAAETARSTQAPGAYWSGHSGYVQPRYDTTKVEKHYVKFEHEGVNYRGLLVTCIVDGLPLAYVIVTDKDVDLPTFKKYLFFYPQHVSRHLIIGDKNLLTYMPYRIDKRLVGIHEDKLDIVTSF